MNEPAPFGRSVTAMADRMVYPPAPGRRPAFDPELVGHDPAFAAPRVRGEPVEVGRMTAEALRRRFASPPAWQPEIVADARLAEAREPLREAAVLIPLVMHDGGPTVLLTRRTAHLHDHAGQISFPGGGIEQHDDNAVATALRETEEEVGLRADAVEVLGSLPRYATATGYVVTPVVGLVVPGFALEIDTFEVEEVFEPPLAFLMNPAHHERRLVDFGGLRRTFYAMPYEAGRRYFIWGATAAMLRNLYHLLRA
jgi:8-oxo-dGTP pyrophosphatase MutT (NUDIX family)